MFKNSSNISINVLITWAISLFIVACSDDSPVFKEEETNIKVKLNLEQGYETNQLTENEINIIISPTGDTVETGVPYHVTPSKIDNDTLTPPAVIKAGKGGMPTKAFRLYYYPEQIDTVEILKDSLERVQLGAGDQDFVMLTDYGDTIITGVPVKIKPKIVKSKAPIVTRSMPPYYMDNCYSDIQSLDVAQGLTSGYINSFYQDKNKNLWFGTASEGLGRYDGIHFYFYKKDHGLLSDDIRGLVADEQGNIWMYTEEGLCMFDGNYFYHYTEKQQFFEDLGQHVARDSSGNIWAGSLNGGLAKFDGQYFTFYTQKEGLKNGSVTDLSIDAEGNVWFSGRGVCKFDGKVFTYYMPGCGLSAATSTDIFCTKDGRVWATVGDGLIECICKEKIVKYGKLDGLDVRSEHKTLFEDSKGNLWIGTPIGACIFDGEKIQRFTTLEGQVWKAISAIMEDEVGNIWLGTFGSGMHRYKENSFSMLNTYHGLIEDVVFAVHEDNEGNMWFGSREGGVSKFDGKNFTHYSQADGLAGDRVRWITQDSKGNMWFGTNHQGVSKFDGEYFTNYNENNGLSHGIVKCILEDSKGNMWFATFNGLTKFDGDNFYHYTREEGFRTPKIWSILEDSKGNLWLGTDESGLVKFDGENFISFTEKEGLSTNRMRALTMDDFGNIWIGSTDKGVVKFDGESFQYFSEDQGLCNNVVMSIITDNDNNVWVATDHGLSVIENNHAGNDSHIIRNFSYVDGLKALDFNTTSAFADSKNNIWLPTGKGITTINADYVSFNYNEPLVQMNYLTVADEYVDFRKENTKVKYKISYDSISPYYNYPVNPTFHFSIKHIAFHFSAIDWSAPHRIQYSYKLEGLNDEWSKPTFDAQVDFRNLNPGDYVFYVRAKGDNGVWCEPFKYPFTISTPWWETYFAYGLYVAGFIMFFVLLLQWRTRRLKVRQALLEKRIALATEKLQEQNDQLGTQNIEIEQQKAEVEKQKEIIESNHQQIKDSIHYSKKIQHSLLLSPVELRVNYSNFFLLFEPKDIVSGDFYFFRQFGDIDYIACVDCTGHGVPGGFMSTLGYLLMDKIIQDSSKHPGDILDELSEALIQTLHQQDADSIQDGMDMSLCRVDRKNRTIEFSGARNGVLIIDAEKVIHHAPDYLPVGGNYVKNGKPISRKFSTQIINIPEGSWVVLYTDGYVEQLGGVNGLPMRSNEYETIVQMATQIKDQNMIKNYLSEKLLEWQGDEIRIDDICLIGFKI